MDLKSIKEESGKIKKIYAAVKKAVSKEFLWILFIMAISIPIALTASYIISADVHIVNAKIAHDIEEVSEIITNKQPLFRVLYGMSVVGIYFSRMVTAAIKTQFVK
ncbi:hypothetical protein A8C32_05195 [Flavivirga aquatica]|uniref:Uncharacterized protein n=1 Tax=Flavivirga aquatica TaxID=1849968 RepID=A0A1E5SHQ2_9FLAO|nr:hypothetical protein [Flavivirga aquatica]OEJ98596.1 hypothetical protein A8C32_05195 [Flavivirga aquatica]